MAIATGLALWLVMSMPVALLIAAAFASGPAHNEVVGVDGDELLVVTASGDVERTPLTIGV